MYVDDILIASKNRSAIDKLKKMSFVFEMKDLDKAKKVLGVEIERDRKSDKVCLTQKRCLKKIIQKFDITRHTKSVSTLLALHFK